MTDFSITGSFSRRTPGHLLATMATRAPTGGVVASIATAEAGGGQAIQYLHAAQDSAELVFTEEVLGIPRSHGFGYMNINVRDLFATKSALMKLFEKPDMECTPQSGLPAMQGVRKFL
jgi:hypothetical protein